MKSFSIRFIFCLSAVVALTLGISYQADAQLSSKYKIEAEILVDKKEIKAHQTVSIKNNSQEDLTEVYFYIYPNRRFTLKEKEFMMRFSAFFKVNPYPDGFPEPSFKILRISQNEKEIDFSIEGSDETLLKINLNDKLLAGGQIDLVFEFEQKIPHAYGRFGWHKNIMKFSRWYPLLAVYDKKVWVRHPVYPFHRPFFNEASHYEVALTVPNDQVVIHSGVLEKEEVLNVKKTWYLNSQKPIREFSFAMSPDYKVIEKEHGQTKVKSFYLPGDEFYAQRALDYSIDLMNFYEERFGSYEYKEFSIAPVHLGYGGEQMSNIAFIDTRVYKLPKFLTRYFDFLIAHETGHQWFYNMVGINEFSQMWLEEGVHSYFIEQYLDQKYGENATIVDFPQWANKGKWLLPKLTFHRARDIRYKILSRIGYDRATIRDLSSFHEPSSIFSITYGKGSRITETFRNMVGEEAFYRIFRRIFKEYQFKNLDMEDFMRISDEESGQDLSWFFDQWLYSDRHFDMAITKVSRNVIHIQNRGGIAMPFPLKVTYKNGETEEITVSSKEKRFTVHAPEKGPLSQVEIDSQKTILDTDRVNNRWPRHVNLKMVPFYFPVYDHPVFLPDESYNLVVGPELANSGIGVKASFQKPYDQNFYVASDYEFSEQILHSRLGYQLNNLFESQTSFGVEMGNRTDYEDGDDDLATAKIFLRKELWPVQYGLSGINDHASLYIIRNQGLKKTLLLSGEEYDNNVSYLKRNEAIVGMNFHFERTATYPDPSRGYKIDWFYENSGHFWGATQAFNRTAIDSSFYVPITLNSKMAFRTKYGYGYPDDKNLFELGGLDGLRGYDRKEIRGANALLGSAEYRFPIKKDIDYSLFDNIISVNSIDGVLFFDVGEAWYSDFDSGDWKKDAGIGLRLNMDIGSYLEKIILRADIAQPIDETEKDTHFWFGVGHAF